MKRKKNCCKCTEKDDKSSGQGFSLNDKNTSGSSGNSSPPGSSRGSASGPSFAQSSNSGFSGSSIRSSSGSTNNLAVQQDNQGFVEDAIDGLLLLNNQLPKKLELQTLQQQTKIERDVQVNDAHETLKNSFNSVNCTQQVQDSDGITGDEIFIGSQQEAESQTAHDLKANTDDLMVHKFSRMSLQEDAISGSNLFHNSISWGVVVSYKNAKDMLFYDNIAYPNLHIAKVLKTNPNAECQIIKMPMFKTQNKSIDIGTADAQQEEETGKTQDLKDEGKSVDQQLWDKVQLQMHISKSDDTMSEASDSTYINWEVLDALLLEMINI
ncbi:hypothetical protein HK100_010332 [Physocladia obscura]|uniref:Uncharacterized protein n=1 Tax=Physocladia obscura TaxID=109957 RepID=A0AAD5SLA7_9FUNG|nr:hypothetical protein HK100_010332 [Physocladia obscura]